MKRLDKELRKIIKDIGNIIGEGASRTCYVIDNKYVVKMAENNYSNQHRQEKEVYELICKYYPKIADEMVVPIVYFGTHNGIPYSIMERADVSESWHKYSRILKNDFNIYDWETIDGEFKVTKKGLRAEYFSFVDGKLVENQVREEEYFTDEELNAVNPKIVSTLKQMQLARTKSDEFEEQADRLRREMSNMNFYCYSDMHGRNIGLHKGKYKILDLGCFEPDQLKKEIRRDFDIDVDNLKEV